MRPESKLLTSFIVAYDKYLILGRTFVIVFRNLGRIKTILGLHKVCVTVTPRNETIQALFTFLNPENYGQSLSTPGKVYHIVIVAHDDGSLLLPHPLLHLQQITPLRRIVIHNKYVCTVLL